MLEIHSQVDRISQCMHLDTLIIMCSRTILKDDITVKLLWIRLFVTTATVLIRPFDTQLGAFIVDHLVLDLRVGD